MGSSDIFDVRYGPVYGGLNKDKMTHYTDKGPINTTKLKQAIFLLAEVAPHQTEDLKRFLSKELPPLVELLDHFITHTKALAMELEATTNRALSAERSYIDLQNRVGGRKGKKHINDLHLQIESLKGQVRDQYARNKEYIYEINDLRKQQSLSDKRYSKNKKNLEVRAEVLKKALSEKMVKAAVREVYRKKTI